MTPQRFGDDVTSSDMADRDENWQAATSAPFDTLTGEGRFRATQQATHNLRYADARLRRHQWRMARTGLVFVGLAVALCLVVAVVTRSSDASALSVERGTGRQLQGVHRGEPLGDLRVVTRLGGHVENVPR